MANRHNQRSNQKFSYRQLVYVNIKDKALNTNFNFRNASIMMLPGWSA